jgi:cob(I)alamin adenosyltransferase
VIGVWQTIKNPQERGILFKFNPLPWEIAGIQCLRFSLGSGHERQVATTQSGRLSCYRFGFLIEAIQSSFYVGQPMIKVYTRTGDDGTTGTYKGGRIPKDDDLIEAIGAVDELNSTIGYLVSGLLEGHKRYRTLRRIQHHLFDLGAALASIFDDEQFQKSTENLDVAWLEATIDDVSGELPTINQFILPGGTRNAAIAHLCRSICRRAERNIITALHSFNGVDEPKSSLGFALIRFMNRLSDCLFVLARSLNHEENHEELFWQAESTGADPLD